MKKEYENNDNIINNFYSYSNIKINNRNDYRFNRLHSRLDEINIKISKEKMDKESFIHNKITNTELILKNNNENCLRKINEVKNTLKSLTTLLEQIKLFTKGNNEETEEIFGKIKINLI
jgi:hypothetical protein